ncbi:MAG: ParB N-terminal domain-containing protein [Planctomycetes bacterium]|nr:ParB N-terminal domain-containing protein [Planctomycetota bacterium]
MEVYSTPGSSQIVNYYEDGTHGDYAIDGETAELLPLVTGRRTTGQVIKAGVDCVTYDEGRSIISPMPGVWVSLHADGVNALTPALRTDPFDPIESSWYGANTSSFSLHNIFGLAEIPVLHGASDGPEGDTPSAATALANAAAAGTGIHRTPDGTRNSDVGTCACRQGNPSAMELVAGYVSPGLGTYSDHIGGTVADFPVGMEFCGWPGFTWSDLLRKEYEERKAAAKGALKRTAHTVAKALGADDETAGSVSKGGEYLDNLGGMGRSACEQIVETVASAAEGYDQLRRGGLAPVGEGLKEIGKKAAGDWVSGAGILVKQGYGPAGDAIKAMADAAWDNLSGANGPAAQEKAVNETGALLVGTIIPLGVWNRLNLARRSAALQALRGEEAALKVVAQGGAAGERELTRLLTKVDDAARAGKNKAARVIEEATTETKFRSTDSTYSQSSQDAIADLTSSMKCKGWVGDAIKVYEHDGVLYILDGHHRVAAAKAAGVAVTFEKVTLDEIRKFGFQTIDDLIGAVSYVRD